MSKIIKYTDDDSAMEIEKNNKMKRTMYSNKEMQKAQSRAAEILKRNLDGEPMYHAVNDLCDIVEGNKDKNIKDLKHISNKVDKHLNSLKDKAMIKCHNDGKGKLQSYEIYINDENCNILEIIPSGYGSTKEEALKEYIYNLIVYMNTIVRFAIEIFPNMLENISMVDYSGKPFD